MSLISPLLAPEHVVLDLEVQDKRAALEHAAGLLERATGVRRGTILDSLLARERLGSTGLGHGIAIPHGRVRGLRQPLGALIRTRNGIAFDAPDDQPVRLIFVLLVPEKSTDIHLEILGGLAQMFGDRQMRGSLAATVDPESAHKLIAGWEARGAR